MATSADPSAQLGQVTEASGGDAAWAAVCLGLCGAWAGYLFSPYLLTQIAASETGRVVIGLVLGAVLAAVGAFLIARRR